VGEKITSWATCGGVAPKFSGKIVIMDLDRDADGVRRSSTRVLHEHAPARRSSTTAARRLSRSSPTLQAFLSTNVGAGLVKGSTVIAMDWTSTSR